MEYPATPQHDKASAEEARRRAAEEFLDWLYDEQHMVLCVFRSEHYQHIDGRKGIAHPTSGHAVFPTDPDVPMDFEQGDTYTRAERDDYWWVPEGHYPVVSGDMEKGRLLATYIGVEYDAYMAEKQAVFDYVVAKNREAHDG